LTNICTQADMPKAITELDTDWRAHRTAFVLHCRRIPVNLPLQSAFCMYLTCAGSRSLPQNHGPPLPNIPPQRQPALHPHL
jgi:hypothetical protein